MEFDGLDATEKTGIGAALTALISCRVLAAKIANELRNERPEHFVDKLSLADIHASLERAADGVAGAGPSAASIIEGNLVSARSHGRDKDLSRAEAARSR